MSVKKIVPLQNNRTYNFDAPCEGAKTIPLLLDFGAFTEYDVDCSQLTQQSQISMIQTIFVDTSNNAAAMVIAVDPNGINQVIVANGNTQGYYPILAPNPLLITFSSTSGVVQKVQLINAPIAGSVWAATHP